MKRLYKLLQNNDTSPVIQEQLKLEKELEIAESDGDYGKAEYLRKKLKRAVKASAKLVK